MLYFLKKVTKGKSPARALFAMAMINAHTNALRDTIPMHVWCRHTSTETHVRLYKV